MTRDNRSIDIRRADETAAPRFAFMADVGTTNIRVWLVQGEHIIGVRRRPVGIRDSAQHGSSAPINEALRDCIAELEANHQDIAATADSLIAAGMITSGLGLAEVPHVPAPAGAPQLAASIRRFTFPEITHREILLVPGIRCGSDAASAGNVDAVDMMRGEEVLCIGLMEGNRLPPGGRVLNVGSHWKLIGTDAEERIVSSWSTLSGELLQETATRTVLASSLPGDFADVIDRDWLGHGIEAQRKCGLSRALYTIRLLHVRGSTTPDQRFSYLVGAYVGSDLDAMQRTGRLSAGDKVLITGRPFIAGAWQHALTAAGNQCDVISGEEIESAFLRGLSSVAALLY